MKVQEVGTEYIIFVMEDGDSIEMSDGTEPLRVNTIGGMSSFLPGARGRSTITVTFGTPLGQQQASELDKIKDKTLLCLSRMLKRL